MTADLLTVQEAADLLDVSTTTIHRRIEDGTLTPAHKLPGDTGAYLLHKNDVEALKAA